MFIRIFGVILSRIVGVVRRFLLIFGTREQVAALRQLQHIPSEILSDILIRLLAASLGRMKSASKQWLEIISDPDFIESHLARQEFDLICSILLDKSGYNTFFFKRDTTFGYPQRGKLIARSRIHGSFRGLVLLYRDRIFYVANPLTGHILRLPPLGNLGSPNNANIGFSSPSREFKVVVVDQDITGITCLVLTLRRHEPIAWRKVDVPFPSGIAYLFRSPIFARGSLHWIYGYRSALISMDLEQEVFCQQTNLPSCVENYNYIFLEWNGSFAVVPKFEGKQSYCIFTLRGSEWTVALEVDNKFFEHLCPSQIFVGAPPYPVASCRDGEVIIFMKVAQKGQFFAYHISSRIMKSFTAKAPHQSSDFLINRSYYPSGSIMAHVDSLCSW